MIAALSYRKCFDHRGIFVINSNVLLFPVFVDGWIRSDTEVGEVGRVRADEETRLFMTNAQPEDTGNYSCVATNMAANKKAHVWIVVSSEYFITTVRLNRAPAKEDFFAQHYFFSLSVILKDGNQINR